MRRNEFGFREIQDISIMQQNIKGDTQINLGRFYVARRKNVNDDLIYNFMEFYVELNTDINKGNYNFIISIKLKKDIQNYFYHLSINPYCISLDAKKFEENYISEKFKNKAIGYSCYKCRVELDDDLDINKIKSLNVIIEEIGDNNERN